MRRLALLIALALIPLTLVASRPATAGAPALTTTYLAEDVALSPGMRVAVLAIDLPPGPYLLSGQVLVGAAATGTTCTAALAAGDGLAAYSQASTHEAGEIATLATTFGVFLVASSTRVELSVACVASSMVAHLPNALLPESGQHVTPDPRSATWLTAVPLHGTE